MLGPGWYTFESTDDGLTFLADAGDVLQGIGGANPYILLEMKVWQTGTDTLDSEDLRIIRVQGGSGAGGNALTEHEFSPAGPAATVAFTSLPTTDLGGTPDYDEGAYFNNLQGVHILNIPELFPPLAIGADIAIGNQGTIAHTGVGLLVKWAEFNP